MSALIRLVAILMALHSAAAVASVSFSGSGLNPETHNNTVSAEASFSLLGQTLVLTLTNTSGATAAQGDALTGLLFNIGGTSASAVLDLSSVALASGSEIWNRSKKTIYVDNNMVIQGSWTDSLSSNSSASAGMATTGFNGEFKAGTITVGNSSANYGIVGAGTFESSGFSGASYPFIENSLVFTLSITGTLLESDISGVRFLFGTDGSGVVSGNSVVVATPGTSVLISDGSTSNDVPTPAVLPLIGVAMLATRVRRAR